MAAKPLILNRFASPDWERKPAFQFNGIGGEPSPRRRGSCGENPNPPRVAGIIGDAARGLIAQAAGSVGEDRDTRPMVIAERTVRLRPAWGWGWGSPPAPPFSGARHAGSRLRDGEPTGPSSWLDAFSPAPSGPEARRPGAEHAARSSTAANSCEPAWDALRRPHPLWGPRLPRHCRPRAGHSRPRLPGPRRQRPVRLLPRKRQRAAGTRQMQQQLRLF